MLRFLLRHKFILAIIIIAIFGAIGTSGSKQRSTNTEEETAVVTTDEQQEQQVEEEEEEEEVQASVIDPKFKKSMDKYYKFMKKYAKFMKKYQNSDNQIAMMSDYTELLSEYTEWVDAIDSVDEDDLNDAELAYYIDIQAKVSKLLLELE